MINDIIQKIKDESKGVKPSDKIHILLDNGHSSSLVKKITPGKRTPYLVCGAEPKLSMYEGDFNREVVSLIAKDLRDLGYNVHIIVPEGDDITLGERVRRVNKLCKTYGASNCLLVSVHSNAAGNGRQWLSARGFSAHVCGGCSSKSKLLANLLFDAAKEDGHFKMRKPLPNQKYWENNFYIIKNTYCPAVLTESGFYDNIEDCEYLLTSEGRINIAAFHVKAIINYINSILK